MAWHAGKLAHVLLEEPTMSTNLSTIDKELDTLKARLDEAGIDLTASREAIDTLEQAREIVMARAVDDSQASKEALKLEDEITSAKRMMAISSDIFDQIKLRIELKKVEARKAELAEQQAHTIKWEIAQQDAVQAAIEAMEPHIREASKAGYARGVNVSLNICHKIKVAITNITSQLNNESDREAIRAPESRHLVEKDRSAISSRHRTPSEKQQIVNERLEREASAREQNALIGKANTEKRR